MRISITQRLVTQTLVVTNHADVRHRSPEGVFNRFFELFPPNQNIKIIASDYVTVMTVT